MPDKEYVYVGSAIEAAQEASRLHSENTELRARIEQLERRLEYEESTRREHVRELNRAHSLIIDLRQHFKRGDLLTQQVQDYTY